MKRQLYYFIPASFRPLARRIYYLPIDIFESVMHIRPEGVPPRGKVFVGYGDYVKQGEKFLRLFTEIGGLKPHHRVLDVGCGIGRMAYPLSKFLSPEGSYEGFDIVKSGIDWCTKHITTSHPNFRFLYTGMYNQLYNTAANKDASGFVFPYEKQSFDFAFLTSVFTHMMPEEVDNYLGQISKVMKPGSSCFMTFFLVNSESENLMATAPTHMNFPVNKGHYRLHSAAVDTANVAYSEDWVESRLKFHGLQKESVHYGQWCGRERFLDYQDIIICRKV